MKEGLQSVKDCKKAAEEKAIKKAKFIEELKKQLQKKLTIIQDKNKALIDDQRKTNEIKKKLLELQ